MRDTKDVASVIPADGRLFGVALRKEYELHCFKVIFNL